MPGDEVHEGEGAFTDAAPGARGRTGPRHAAPRKPLLTRLHLPAGKAVALAAMPSAVLMGMGLMPQLANAKPLPKNPFKGDSCVSISDQQETEAEKQDRKERAEKLKRDLAKAQAEREKKAEKAKEAAEAKEKARGKSAGGKGGSGDEGSSKTPSGSGKGSSTPSDEPSPSDGSTGSSSDSSNSSDSSASSGSSDSSEEGKKNPWYDPLGLGDKIDDAFNPDKDKDKDADDPADGSDSSPSPDPTPSAPSPGSGSDDDSSGQDGNAGKSGGKSGTSGDSGSSSRNTPGSGTGGKTDGAQGSGKQEKGSAGSDAKDGKDTKDGVDKKDGSARDYDPAKDAGKPYPCPEKADVAGSDEQTPAQVPDDPWNLEASSLTLKGLDYKGVVNITTANGKTKQALKFTASGLDIGDLHQTVKGPGGLTYHVQAAKGSTSTIRDGQVTMYTEELKGNLFGLIPITFSPDTPPPINVPFAYFTDVTVKQAGQFGGTLTVPGLHQYVEQ